MTAEREATVAGFPLGIASAAFRPSGLTVPEMADRAIELGFAFLDLCPDEAGFIGPLSLPVVDRFSPVPCPGFTTAIGRPPASWADAVAAFAAAPGSRLEPTTFGILRSVAAVRAFVAEVPGLRLTLDTGHVAAWGDDPGELIDLADHVQLRQARRGEPQSRVHDGAVDFPRFLTQLAASGYRGGVSVEYFDLPDRGMPVDDPLGHSLELAAYLRSLG